MGGGVPVLINPKLEASALVGNENKSAIGAGLQCLVVNMQMAVFNLKIAF
jgi:hypothetical protein